VTTIDRASAFVAADGPILCFRPVKSAVRAPTGFRGEQFSS